MKKIIVIFLCFFFLYINVAAAELTTQQKWAFAGTALVAERYGQSSEVLGGLEYSEENVYLGTNVLKEKWAVEDRETLLAVLSQLELSGHRQVFNDAASVLEKESFDPEWEKLFRREIPYSYDIVKIYHKELGKKSLLGWDYMRYIMLCRWGYLVGYLTEEEAWEMILPKTIELQQTFDSWEDLGKNYLIGLQFWPKYSKEFNMKNYQKFSATYKRLQTHPSSIWKQIKWEEPLMKK